MKKFWREASGGFKTGVGIAAAAIVVGIGWSIARPWLASKGVNVPG